VEREEE